MEPSRQFQYLILCTLLVLFLASECYGQAVNVALNKPVNASFTCGSFGLEKYKMKSDFFVFGNTRQYCALAPVSTSNNALGLGAATAAFPPSLMVDGNLETRWQSTSRMKGYGRRIFREESAQNLEAIINIDLQQEFLVDTISIQLGDAMTPQRVAIQKSMDGITFESWIFAVTDLRMCSEWFQTVYNMVPGSLTDTICIPYMYRTSFNEYVTIEIDISSVPGNLKEWTRVRYLKVKFYDMLFIAPFNDMADQYNHYAIRELSVFAECPCNGQQTSCQPSNTTGMYECVCGGNTRGRFCETCLPMYNQFPFTFGQECQECNCFNHATSCIYQQSVAARNQSLDITGNYNGGGVCLDCQHNTAGINCERCASLYYRPAGVDPTAEDACVACACNASGSMINEETGLRDCVVSDQVQTPDGKAPGDCYCKANVQGSKCNQCKVGFYNLDKNNEDGCTACDCYTPGTIGASGLCDSGITGQCNCKANVQGRACDECADGFYSLTADNPDGCQPCNCDIGGSVNNICDKLTGQCQCRSENVLGRRCNGIRSGYFFPSPHYVSAELEDSFGDITTQRNPDIAGFSGQGYAVGNQGDSFSVLLDVSENTRFSHEYLMLIRYRTDPATVQSTTLEITKEAGDLSTSLDLPLPVCSTQWCLASTENIGAFNLSVGPNLFSVAVTAGQAYLDSIIAVPVEYANIDPELGLTFPDGCNVVTNTMPTDPTLASQCQASMFSLTMSYWNAPLQCNCDLIGSSSVACNFYGGQCDCQPNVVGRTCNTCDVGYFGLTSTGCSACNCDAVSTVCDSLTGQCQCPDNTVGRQCEVCLPNHWGWDRLLGCKACECDPLGSLSPQCNGTTGICTCKEGTEGDNCDQCQDGFYYLEGQGCVACGCNEAGSIGPNCNKTSGECECKAFVNGTKCDTCILGTFGLDADNADGCLDCVCMGITGECQSAQIPLATTLYPLSMVNDTGSLEPNLQTYTEDGNFFDSVELETETEADGTIGLVIFPETGQPRLFWEMPQEVIPTLLDLYKTSVHFNSTYVITDDAGFPFTDLRAVLRLRDGSTLTHALSTFPEEEETELQVDIVETAWTDPSTGLALSRADFLKSLALTETMLIPASFSAAKHTARISSLSYSDEDAMGVVNTQVELCNCGPEYVGKSCQQCAPGLRRVNVSSSDFLGECSPCDCNDHSTTCDPDTGACIDCAHNTAGDNCEVCAVGFYGDATQGTPTDCSPCPCFEPRVKNATCAPVLQPDNTTVVTCLFCQDGYVGTLCDQCSPSYFGNPEVPGGTCSPCECNGNSDTCNLNTGICENCLFNTTGDRCDQCEVNFYGNASQQACQACDCNPDTSNATQCDTVTGQCLCAPGVTGRTCNQCFLGYWGFSNTDFRGCRSCGCVEAGSTGIQCNADNGQCPCKVNTVGSTCDSCVDDFFGLPEIPCTDCTCNPIGTVTNTNCDKVTGQCQCKSGVTGRTCDQCLPFFVDFSDVGCTECGQCHTSLRDNIATLISTAQGVFNLSQDLLAVQSEDVRLIGLTDQLQYSLESLGLAGKDVTSVNDLVANATQRQNELSLAFETTSGQVAALLSTMEVINDSSSFQLERHSTMEEKAKFLDSNVTQFQEDMDSYIQYLTVYNSSASEYLNQGAESVELNISLATELTTAQNLLQEIQDSADRDSIDQAITEQALEADEVVTSANDLAVGVQSQALKLSEASENLNLAAFTGSVVENALEQGLLYKSQAEVLLDAINEILTTTEGANTELLATLNNASLAASNTQAIYSGIARSVMTGDDFMQFPPDVTNYQNGLTKLNGLLTSLPVLVNSVTSSIQQSETAAAKLEDDLEAINSTFETMDPIGTDAVNAINSYNEVVTDLSNALRLASQANELITQVSNTISGDALNSLGTEYQQEKENADLLVEEYAALDYKPQVLLSQLVTADSRLDNTPGQWQVVDSQLDSVSVTAQALNTELKDNNLLTQLQGAQSQLQATVAKAQSVLDTATAQSDVVTQKEEQLRLVESQSSRVQELDTSIRNKLTTHESNFQTFQTQLDQATSQSSTSATTRARISEKINQLESKLDEVETLLNQLRQPVSFDGQLGLELTNPQANVPHMYDDLTVEVRKPADFTDGVILFTEGTTSEIEVGVSNDKFFMEFNTGSELVRVDSPAEVCGGCWAKVSASRYARTGYLTVELMSTGGSVSASAAGTSTASAIQLSSPIYLGTLPSTLQTTKVSFRQFRGCIREVTYQDQPYSLWSAALASGKTVTCCQGPDPLPAPALITGISFGGFSHIVLGPPTNILFSSVIRMSVELRTSMSNAFVFTTVSPDGRTKFSINMKDGQVEWEIISDGRILFLRSQRQYATSTWIEIIASIETTVLRLTVNSLDAPNEGSDVVALQKPALDLTPLNGQNLIFGANSNPLATGYTPSSSNFAGCLKNVKLTSTSVTATLGFNANIQNNVRVSTAGCYSNVIPGFRFDSPNAYMTIEASSQISALQRFQVTFLTEESKGVLLYIQPVDAARFLYLSVFGGHLILVYRQETAGSVVTTGPYVSDGQLHTVRVDCSTQRISMIVDGQVFEENQQTLNSNFLTFRTTSIFFVGGVRGGVNVPSDLPVRTSLIGGISHVTLNNIDIIPANIIDFQNISLAGIPAPSDITPAPPVPPTLPPQPCATPLPAILLPPNQGIRLDGSQFVDWSNQVSMDVLAPFFVSSFLIEMDFASYKADGVLLYADNGVGGASPTQYVGIYLINGLITVDIRTTLGQERETLASLYNTARRYKLRVMRINNFISLNVESERDSTTNSRSSAEASQINIPTSNRVFVGGLAASKIPSSALPAELRNQPGRADFAGAIYLLNASSNPNQVSLDFSALDRTIFPAVPQTVIYGMSMSGTNSYLNLGSVNILGAASIGLTFTTTSASAIMFALLLAGSPNRFIVMDVMEQNIRLHLSPSFTGITEPFTTQLLASSGICDGQSHTLTVELDNTQVSISIDGGTRSATVNIPTGHAIVPVNGYQFFIGGIPATSASILPAGMTRPSMRGCVQSVTYNPNIDSPTDLSTTYDPTDYFLVDTGVSYGCPL